MMLAVLHIRCAEHTDNVRTLAQNITAAASYHNARAFFCRFADNFCFFDKQLITHVEVRGLRNRACRSIASHDQRVQKAIGRLFIKPLENLAADTGIFRRHIHDLRIVERNSQHLCQTLAHDMSGRAKLSLNGINGRSCHNMNPIPSRSPSRPIVSGTGFVHKCAVFCFCIISHFCYHEKQAHALSQSGAYFPSICRIFRPPKPPKRRGVLLKNLNIFHENAEKNCYFLSFAVRKH